jgi:hypothetical protein
MAFANRSVVYMKLGYHKTALENIKLARENNYPRSKMDKLLEREQCCQEKVRTGDTKEDSFQKNKDAKQKHLMQTLPANKKYPCYVADCLTLENSETFGRHIRTNRDLKVGTIVMTEKHTAAQLVPEIVYQRCEFCKASNILSLLSCDSCTKVMYCSEKCRQDDFEYSHKYMCGIHHAIDFTEFAILKFFCFGLSCFENPTEFAEFLRETEDSSETAWDMDFRGLEQKEINKKLFQTISSYKLKNPAKKPQQDSIKSFRLLSWFTTTVLNFTKFKNILVTEEQKDLFRNFAFRHIQFSNHSQFYSQFDRWVPTSRAIFEQLGTGILFFASFMNHSCAPNIQKYYDGSKMHFIVLRPIKKGGQLFISGAQCFALFEFKERHEHIKNVFNFDCKCEACKNPRDYPVFNKLPIKNKQIFQNLAAKMYTACNAIQVDVAAKNFRALCDFLDKNDHQYPSQEILLMSGLIERSAVMFSATSDYP